MMENLMKSAAPMPIPIFLKTITAATARSSAGAMLISSPLLYLLWEPENWNDFNVFKIHWKEIENFTNQVKGSAVKFVARSHPELWKELDEQKNISDHAANLRNRYSLSI
jgi:hypothetical protein